LHHLLHTNEPRIDRLQTRYHNTKNVGHAGLESSIGFFDVHTFDKANWRLAARALQAIILRSFNLDCHDLECVPVAVWAKGHAFTPPNSRTRTTFEQFDD
jgi:hypothetical protein